MKTTGLTPTEYAHEEAARFNTAVQLQNAYHEGVQGVRQRQEADAAVAKMKP